MGGSSIAAVNVARFNYDNTMGPLPRFWLTIKIDFQEAQVMRLQCRASVLDFEIRDYCQGVFSGIPCLEEIVNFCIYCCFLIGHSRLEKPKDWMPRISSQSGTEGCHINRQVHQFGGDIFSFCPLETNLEVHVGQPRWVAIARASPLVHSRNIISKSIRHIPPL